MKRRRRGLGSSPKEHETQGIAASNDVIANAEQATEAVAGGRCNIAYQHLKQATLAYGKVIVHDDASGGRIMRGGITLAVQRATDAFGRACVVKR